MKRLLLLIFLILTLKGNSCESVGSSDLIRLTGRISVKGNTPVHWLCLSTAEGKAYRLEGTRAQEIRDRYQQEVLTLEGRIVSGPEGPFPATLEVVRILPSPTQKKLPGKPERTVSDKE